MSSSYENEFNIVKKAHLNFINYLNSLEQSLTRIEKATDKYNEDHKIASWLTEKSALVSNHSGKIAITYVSLIVGVIALRSYVVDEKDPWYELCALPTTSPCDATNFMQNKLIKFLHDKIVPALIENKKFTAELLNHIFSYYINIPKKIRIRK
ncbi:hypothetical protein N7280_06610 [Rickettsia rhipicephali]|uniref:hypothetical protein n=1 Tax=Rickettsia rhipicephali TaxID=33992 RepID=UPI00225C235A|nr:hypothetical protein [Rickettsia rhipicephali]MCX4080239.1 hypothetical protein [Rickettsia rhipicephali]